ncbi:5-oxoprolinase subunit PxpB [Bacillus massiliglaciei]|uniref:5-oxoprolinase subunit PxpB n=1 Tax=Bacillus massiliglaciei TaxID=1816693 RepID=UPI000B1D282E|nr:5-oxoprolinase subunit PxpB [Bacillus massiliglaciei]
MTARHTYDMTPLGDSAIVVTFGKEINEDTLKRIKGFMKSLEDHPFAGFIECVPAFLNVTVFYDPVHVYTERKKKQTGAETLYETVQQTLETRLSRETEVHEFNSRTIAIPVCYGGKYGPDLGDVARHNGLTAEEVIEIHSQGKYLAYMIGFAPGFPFLGGMSKKIAAPRRSSPRKSIPAGSVGIAGEQTGVYPISTPGGWQLIGRTPTALFLPDENPPSLIQAGDYVEFYPITPRQYEEALQKGEKV